MNTEETIRRFLEKECFTTPKAKDPRRPLILDGKFVKLNPDFDPALVEREARGQEVERRKNHLGTSFFLNFDPLCKLHQLQGYLGDSVRKEIARSLHQRFIEVFVAQFPKNPPQVEWLKGTLEVAICSRPQPGFNNGEVYLWLPGIPFKEDFVFDFLRKFRNSIEDNPIMVDVEGKDYEASFYGWGFRYI